MVRVNKRLCENINALKQKLDSLERELEQELRTLRKCENLVKRESDNMVVTKKQRMQLHTEDRIKGSKRRLQDSCDREFGRKKRVIEKYNLRTQTTNVSCSRGLLTAYPITITM